MAKCNLIIEDHPEGGVQTNIAVDAPFPEVWEEYTDAQKLIIQIHQAIAAMYEEQEEIATKGSIIIDNPEPIEPVDKELVV